MLRGLDASGATRDAYDPPAVRVAGRDGLPIEVTLHVRDAPRDATVRRFHAARGHLALLDEADVIRSARYVRWPARVDADGDAAAAVRSLYAAVREAAGSPAVAPVFERTADGGLSTPPLALAVGREDRLTGLYPRSRPDGVESVADGVVRLATGTPVENLTPPR